MRIKIIVVFAEKKPQRFVRQWFRLCLKTLKAILIIFFGMGGIRISSVLLFVINISLLINVLIFMMRTYNVKSVERIT